jgi:hypothetical protein
MRAHPPVESAEAHDEVEALLTREGRAALSLSRQLLVYLDPFCLFKDATRGSANARALALAYNRARRAYLLTYVRRWLLIAATFFVALAPTEALAADAPALIVATAVLGIGCAVALAVAARAAAVYLLLGPR